MTAHTLEQLALLVDHTNLHANATTSDIDRLCEEACERHFASVMVNECHVAHCAERLAGMGDAARGVGIGSVVGFPLGQTDTAVKVFEARAALAAGATEIDYVANLSDVRDGAWDAIEDEMAAIVDVCHAAGVTSKVIFENCYLTDDEKIGLCEVASRVRPTFVKTSTGFGTGGATLADVRLMRTHVDPAVKVKAAGGIRTADDFLAYVDAGAERIGCSAGIPILDELRARMERDGVTTIGA